MVQRVAYMKLLLGSICVAVCDAPIEENGYAIRQMFDEAEQRSSVSRTCQIQRFLPSTSMSKQSERWRPHPSSLPFVGNNGQAHLFLLARNGQVEERVAFGIAEKLSRLRKEKIDAFDMSGSRGTVQRSHSEPIDRIDQMRMSLENRVHGHHVPVGGCVMQRGIAVVALGELRAFVQEQLNDAHVSVLAREVKRRLT